MRAARHILAFALSSGLVASAAAQAPIQIGPPAVAPAPPATPKAAAPKPPAKPATRTPSPAPAQAAPAAAPTAPAFAAAPTASRREADMAYGAFQRGHYITAFAIATRRVEEQKDVKAMTLLGELYANGLGIDRDDKKAADWYRLAADRGDRESMFALAMFHLGGRTGAPNREQAAKLLAAAAKLGHAASAYNLGLSTSKASCSRRILGARPSCSAPPPSSEIRKPNTRSRLSYKEGRGVPKDLNEAARLLGAAALADNTDAQVEYAIALFNGLGVARDETCGGGAAREGGTQRQPYRAKPSRQHPCRRPRRAGQSGGGDQMAHHRQGRRRQ